MAGESVQLQTQRALFLDKLCRLPLRFECHAGDPGQIGQCDADVMQWEKVLDDFNREAGGRNRPAAQAHGSSPADGIGVEQVQDVSPLGSLVVQGHPCRRGQVGFQGGCGAEKPINHLCHIRAVGHGAVGSIQGKDGMREIGDIPMDDPAIESGGFRARRSMLMAAKMLVGPVEIGIVDFSQRLPGCRSNPLRAQIHDDRGIQEIGTQFRGRKDIVR